VTAFDAAFEARARRLLELMRELAFERRTVTLSSGKSSGLLHRFQAAA
jgi:hypothetical protein